MITACGHGSETIRCKTSRLPGARGAGQRDQNDFSVSISELDGTEAGDQHALATPGPTVARLCQHPHDPAGPCQVRLAHSPQCQRPARNHALELRPRQSLRQLPARPELPVAHRSTAFRPTIRRDSAPVQLRAASGLPLVTPMLTLVAKSLYAELESCEVGAASLGDGGSVFPGSDAQQVDGCCGNDMLQVGFGKSAIASAA